MTGRLTRACTVLALLTGAVWAQEAPARLGGAFDLSTKPKIDLNQVLEQSEIVTLDAPGDMRDAMTVVVPIEGEQYTFILNPHSIRSEHYQILVQGEDGVLTPAEPGPVQTMRGTVREIDRAVVAASLLDDGFYAMLQLPEGGRYFIEPLANAVPGAQANEYLVYRDMDVKPSGMFCATGGVSPWGDAGLDGGVAGGCGGSDCVAELGCDTDVQYFQGYGSVSAVENQINSIINTVNVQYQNEVDITHEITTIIVRTSEPDPYTSNDPFTLLAQFRNEWLANQQGVPYDLAHLFTGRNLNGNVIGIAWTIGAVCNTNSFCLAESDFSSLFACKTDLSAHELGHLWGADHCSCPFNTMNSSITCANDFHNTFTVPEIVAYRNTLGCLSSGGGGGGACPGSGACDSANGTIGCDNVDCCEEICALDPFCCDVSWDSICADEAIDFCESTVSCDDVMIVQARCHPTHGAIQMRVILNNSGHVGETVTFSVDGELYDTTINANNRGQVAIFNQAGTGAHTIELVSPANCWDPIDIFCD